ncbi:hypothetical protein MASR2M70_11570 [Bacillota bacterium]
MYVEPIFFQNGLPIALEVSTVTNYHLHSHEGVIEVLLLLRGTADVKVSFEHFLMKTGDFIVINSGDSHSIYAQGNSAVVLSIYFDMNKLREHIPHLEYVLFACESFDLVRYKNETHRLRNMIGNLALTLALAGEGDGPLIQKLALDFVGLLVRDYDMKNYYSRNWDAGDRKTEKYYRITGYIFRHYSMPNLVEYISSKEHYSKSYIVHLYKEVGASSFQGVLTYIRLFRSEKLLLDTNNSIQRISEEVGFSDVKYYTQNFKQWFRCTPSEYRKLYQPEVLKGSIFSPCKDEEWFPLAKECIRDSMEDSDYRGAITPLNIGSHEGWKDSWDREAEMTEGAAEAFTPLVAFEIGESSNLLLLAEAMEKVAKEGRSFTLIIDIRDMNTVKLRALLMKCSDAMSDYPKPIPTRLLYTMGQDRKIIEEALKQCREKIPNLNIRVISLMKM